MRMLSATELLGVWERGRVQGPIEQALLLLATACPDTPTDELARLSIGQRDHALLRLRESTFGRVIFSMTSCPQCGEQLELESDAAGLCPEPASSETSIARQATTDDIFSLVIEGYTLRFRSANSVDLSALAGSPDSINNKNHDSDRNNNALKVRTSLLERCILTAHRDGAAVALRSLPDTVVGAISNRMAEVDPYADLQLSATCPACSNRWPALFDVVSYFWDEIDCWARRVLHEVHLLAHAYGWSEQDILNLSPLRRQCYLDMVSA